jgi:hypothetical protein
MEPMRKCIALKKHGMTQSPFEAAILRIALARESTGSTAVLDEPAPSLRLPTPLPSIIHSLCDRLNEDAPGHAMLSRQQQVEETVHLGGQACAVLAVLISKGL